MKFSRKGGEIFKVNRRGTSKFLGDLEARVMEVVWKLGEATVREVKEHLEKGGKKLAYTTVLTEMQNLEKKGLLKSRREQKKNVYSPTVSRKEFLDKMVGDTLKSLIEDFPEEVISHLLPEEEVDEEEIKRLLKLLKERRYR